jgi:hypothetical protein
MAIRHNVKKRLLNNENDNMLPLWYTIIYLRRGILTLHSFIICKYYFKNSGIKLSETKELKYMIYFHLLPKVLHFVCLFDWLSFTSHRHSIGHIATFKLFWWRKTSESVPCIISGKTDTWVEPPTFRKLAG